VPINERIQGFEFWGRRVSQETLAGVNPFRVAPREFPDETKSNAPAVSEASRMWFFCVASAPGGAEVRITDPFASLSDRNVLEAATQTTLKRRERERVSAQCPQPSSDKFAVVNAQTTAIAFNRNLGAILHALPVRDSTGATP
jgi:hypothetical protein